MSELPGTNECDCAWHRLKFVSRPDCPECGMTVDKFNELLPDAVQPEQEQE